MPSLTAVTIALGTFDRSVIGNNTTDLVFNTLKTRKITSSAPYDPIDRARLLAACAYILVASTSTIGGVKKEAKNYLDGLVERIERGASISTAESNTVNGCFAAWSVFINNMVDIDVKGRI